MFLERIGAGKQAALFLNQPIISEYLKMLDAAGAKGLFTKANINLIKSRFVTTDSAIESAKIDLSKDNLEKNITSFYEKGSLSQERNAEQIKIFNEFLKYAKMAEFNFRFSQAINYDTTKFRSGDALVRKQWRTDIARKTNIISSVDDIFKNSFIGDLEKALGFSMDAMGAIFKLETSAMREITESVLRPYGENDYVGAADFEKIAIKVKSAFLDYIIETKTQVGARLKELLVDSETAVADRLMVLKQKYPNLQILKDLAIDASERPDGAKTVKLIANIKEAYDENLYTGYMRELRDFNDETFAFYKDLVLLSLSQGTYQSPVTFRNIVPIEDYSAIITPVVSALASDESLAAFQTSFSKNNFKDDTIMPVVQPKFFLASEAPVTIQMTSYGEEYADIYQYYSSLFPNIEAFKIKSSDRKILLLNSKYNAFYMGNNFVKVPRVVTNRKTGESTDMKTGRTITKMDYAKMKAKGDLSLSDFYGYERVNLPNGEPLVTYDKEGNEIYVYKLTNLLGDGYRAVEHYTDDRRSVFQNGTVQIENVIPNSDIIEFYGGKIEKKDISSQETTPAETTVTSPESETKINIYAGTGENADLSNFAVRPFIYTSVLDIWPAQGKFKTVEGAFQAQKLGYVYDATEEEEAFNLNLLARLRNASGAEAKSIGRQIKALYVEDWNNDSSAVMRELLLQSFQQNPDALAKLLATGNATLTHTQDKGKWGTEFPRLLMEVRSELRGSVENFDTLEEFPAERKQEILSNFATKHNMTEEQAKDYINKALQEKREEVINKLKECY